MNINEAIDFIHGAQYRGKKNGLENTRALLNGIEIPCTPVPAIHVAGTNGKGSVCAMLNGMLMALGYKVGLYTSPFLQIYQERICINGLPVADEVLIRGVEVIKAAAARLEAEDIHVTTFEIGTALAYWIFAEEKVDAAVIEVGLGGRFDSTNVITPKVSVITTIDYDHMDMLGNTLEEIAYAKAGIIKKGVAVVIHPDNQQQAVRVITQEADKQQAPVILLQKKQIQNPHYEKNFMQADFELTNRGLFSFKVPLAGAYQGENALTALAALNSFIDEDIKTVYNKVYLGLSCVNWPGRLEYVTYDGENYLLEGAHNTQGLKGLKAHLAAFAPANTLMVYGMLKDKINADTLGVLKEMNFPFITVTVDSARSLEGAELKELLEKEGVLVLGSAKTLAEGLLLAKMYLTDKADTLTVIAGSLYLVGEGRKLFHLPHSVIKKSEQKGE